MTPEAHTYLAAVDAFTAQVARIAPSALDGPGLGDWDLRALVGHTSRSLITVITYFDQPAAAEEIASSEDYYVRIARMDLDPAEVTERGRQAGAALGDDAVAAVRDLAAQARAKVEATDPESVITTIIGGMRARAYLPTRTFELVVHGFDIAAASGVEPEFGSDVLAEATQLAARICVATGQAPTLLAALTGRIALPADFSIVP